MISLIDAGPGTGKTFSLVYGYYKQSRQLYGRIEPTEEQEAIFQYLTEEYSQDMSVCFFAYNRSVKEKLEGVLKRTRAKVLTLHGAGLSVLIKRYAFQRQVYNRTEKHIEALINRPLASLPWKEKSEWFAVKRVCHYLKIEALPATQEALDYLILKYSDLASYSLPGDTVEKAAALLSKAELPDGTVEFADMPWLAAKHIRAPLYDLGYVDESQDISNSTYKLLCKMCRNIIFCGDKNQAINAFAGASEEMYQRIQSHSDAVLPLKMTQRCPPLICDHANAVRPGGIMAGPNNHEAIIRTLAKPSLPEILKGTINPANTLFIARCNSTIINLAIYLHTKQIPFQIINKDLADEIDRFIKKFRPASLDDLQSKLDKWIDRMSHSPNEFYAHSCQDKYSYLCSLIATCTSIDDIKRFCKEAFNQEKQGFKLTTAHGSKGLEAQNIFIIDPPIPLSFAMNHPIAREQELNLDFVARTRTSGDLYYVK